MILHGHVLATLVSQTTCLLRLFYAAPRGDRKKQFLLYLKIDVRSKGVTFLKSAHIIYRVFVCVCTLYTAESLSVLIKEDVLVSGDV